MARYKNEYKIAYNKVLMPGRLVYLEYGIAEEKKREDSILGERLKSKVAIVTGAGRGIGRGEAIALTSEGAKVVVNDLGGSAGGTGVSSSPADEVVAEIKKAGDELFKYMPTTITQGIQSLTEVKHE